MIHWVSLTQYFLSLGRDNRLIRGTEEYKGSQLVKTDTFGMVADPSYNPEASFDELGIAPLRVSGKTSVVGEELTNLLSYLMPSTHLQVLQRKIIFQ